MAINLRKVGEVADGSVTEVKLATGAVNLGTEKVTGQLPTEKLEDGAVIEGKLGDLSVGQDKLQDNAVSLSKAQDDLRLHTYVGDETEVSVSGITEEVVKEFRIPIKALISSPNKLRFLATLKTNDIAYEASFKVYVNEEGSPRGIATSSSITYELVDTEFDVSDLPLGRHWIKIVLVSNDAMGIAYNDNLDVMVIK